MHRYRNIEAELSNGMLLLTLSRVEKRNAIDEHTMDELLDLLSNFPGNGTLKMAVLRGRGKDFCAGADLDWMRNTQQMDVQALQKQNMKLQKIFQLWFDLPAFTIALVHGNVVGGGIGLVAASDFVSVRPGATFRFSEVALGLIPATIAPFVLNRTQSRFIRNAMLTAESFSDEQALANGLADVVTEEGKEDVLLNHFKSLLNKTETIAVSNVKKLANDLAFNRIEEPIDVYTTRLLAEVRKSEAASKRIEAFFKFIEKRT